MEVLRGKVLKLLWLSFSMEKLNKKRYWSEENYNGYYPIREFNKKQFKNYKILRNKYSIKKAIEMILGKIIN